MFVCFLTSCLFTKSSSLFSVTIQSSHSKVLIAFEDRRSCWSSTTPSSKACGCALKCCITQVYPLAPSSRVLTSTSLASSYLTPTGTQRKGRYTYSSLPLRWVPVGVKYSSFSFSPSEFFLDIFHFTDIQLFSFWSLEWIEVFCQKIFSKKIFFQNFLPKKFSRQNYQLGEGKIKLK